MLSSKRFSIDGEAVPTVLEKEVKRPETEGSGWQEYRGIWPSEQTMVTAV